MACPDDSGPPHQESPDASGGPRRASRGPQRRLGLGPSEDAFLRYAFETCENTFVHRAEAKNWEMSDFRFHPIARFGATRLVLTRLNRIRAAVARGARTARQGAPASAALVIGTTLLNLSVARRSTRFHS